MRMLALLLCLLMPLTARAEQDQGDRGYIQGLLEDALSAPGRNVRIEGFAGALSSRATIDKITVTDAKGIWLTATDLALSWNRAALLRGAIEIDEITIARIDLPRAPVPAKSTLPSPEAQAAFALPELPVSINIDKLAIARAVLGAPIMGQRAEISLSGSAALSGGSGTAKLTINRLDQSGRFNLSGGFDNASRVLSLNLSLEEPAGGIAVSTLGLPGQPALELVIAGKDPIDDFTATLRLATDGNDRLTGTATLITDTDGANRFALDLGGDVAPVLLPEFAGFLGNRVSLKAEGARETDGALALRTLHLGTAAMQLDGSARIGADGWPRKLSLYGRIAPVAGDIVILPLPGPRISVTGVSFTASFDESAGEAWSIDGRMTGLTRTDLMLDSAGFTGSGRISRAEGWVTGKMQIDARGLAPADPALARALGETLRGRFGFEWGEGVPVSLRDIDLAGADYGLTGAMSLTGLDSLSDLKLTPDLSLSARDLARFGPLAGLDLRGAARLAIDGWLAPLTGQMQLAFNGDTVDLGTGIARLDPLLAGDGRLSLTLERDEAGLRAEPVLISTDHARIEGSARLKTGASDVTVTASLPQTALILPGLQGASDLTATARQDGTAWHLDSEATLPGATRARIAGTLTDTTTLKGRVTLAAGQLSAFSSLAGRRLSGAARIEAEGTGDLTTGSFDLSATGQTTGLALSQPQIDPLLRGTAQLSLAAARNDDGTVTIHAATVKTSAMNADLSGAFGPLGGSLDYRASLANLGVVVAGLPGPASVSGTAQRSASAWNLNVSATGPGGIATSTRGTVAPDASRVDLILTGTAPLSLVNPQLKGQAVSGLARFDLTLRGPLRLSSLSGGISLQDARLVFPERNIALNGIRGRIDFAAGAAQVGLAADVSTGGQVALGGPVALSPPFAARLNADLTAVTLREAALYEADLNGRITVEGPLAGGAVIGGVIDIASVELRLPDTGPSYSPLDGLRHIAPSAATAQTLRFAGLDRAAASTATTAKPYPLDLTLRAPSRIFVRGRGLDAELGGSLRLSGSTDAIAPIGSFDLIRGRLDLLGRRLTLTEGSLRLRGSFDPVIGFAATSQVEDVAISLRLDGLASAPDLTVTSTPDLPQEEALSFFLFGRDVTRISALQAVQLAAAIRTLSGKGGGFNDKLRRKLGVDNLDLGTDAEGVTQAQVGKFLTDKLYTDVTVKGDGTSEINLNLDLSPRVKLRGRLKNDGESGLGVFFEKDY